MPKRVLTGTPMHVIDCWKSKPCSINIIKNYIKRFFKCYKADAKVT